MSEQSLNFKDIDFRGLKEGLISFLRTTDSFKDANFEGSFLNNLANMLSYTGAIFGNYVNAMANEQYIGTCSLYETGNMLGSLVGYKSHGFEASRCSVTIIPDFESMGISENLSEYFGWECFIPINAKFTTRKSNERNKSLVFCNSRNEILTLKNPDLDPIGNPNAIPLDLIQGIPMSIDFVSDGTELQSFEIPNPFIDWTSIRVYVLNEDTDEEEWDSATTWFHGSASSNIFIPFINPKGLLEIMFADGKYGAIPSSGKTIRVYYYATQGSNGQVDSNTINKLSTTVYFINPNDGFEKIEGKFTINQPEKSTFGRNIETLDKIKRFAPLYFGIQNRLVNGFDYSNYILGEYPSIVDCKAFSYRGAVEAELLRSPYQNVVRNPRFSDYTTETGLEFVEPTKLPTVWELVGCNNVFVVERGDVLPIPPFEDEDVGVSDVLNFGTDTALYVDTSRPCDDERGAVLQQSFTIPARSDCCNVVHFEVECLNPLRSPVNLSFPSILEDNISLFINGKKCFTRIDRFKYNTEGYVKVDGCCDREGDVVGWFVVKGVMFIDNDIIDQIDNTAPINIQILVSPDLKILIHDVSVYPGFTFGDLGCSNDVFIVPVPENGGFLGVDQRERMLEKLNPISMINVRNHILFPIYQTFDVRVAYKRDENSLISVEALNNSIRSAVISSFLPINRKLGDNVNSTKIIDMINEIPGVLHSRVILTPRNLDMKNRVDTWGDYRLTDAEFPVLGTLTVS